MANTIYATAFMLILLMELYMHLRLFVDKGILIVEAPDMSFKRIKPDIVSFIRVGFWFAFFGLSGGQWTLAVTGGWFYVYILSLLLINLHITEQTRDKDFSPSWP